MNNNNKIHVNILASNKSGILSSIMLSGRKMGLMFQKNKTTIVDNNNSRLTILFEGNLNCSTADFIKKIESHPEIRKVESVANEDGNVSTIQNLGGEISDSTKLNNRLNAQDSIDEKIIKIANNKLTNYLGPVASILIESAASKSYTVGELFYNLSKELKGEEKESFLSLVDLNNMEYLEVNTDKLQSADTPSSIPEVTPNDQNQLKIELFSHDIITPESLQIAEDKLSKTLGPVAPLLVQSAAEKTKHIGDLFLMLSEELDAKERNDFLDSVSGVDLHKLQLNT